MMYPILLILGLSSTWRSYGTGDEVYRLAWIAISSITLGWGYLSSPTLIQMLSLIFFLMLSYWLIFVFKTNKS